MELRTRKSMSKDMDFVNRKKSIEQIWKTITGYCWRNRTRCFKNCSQKSSPLANKAGEATGEFIENKIADKIVEPKLVPEANSRNVEKKQLFYQKNEKKY